MAPTVPDPALTREFRPNDGKTLPALHGRRTEYREQASGLRLRVTPGDARSWLVSYWSPTAKAQRRLKLGDAAEMKLGRARALARAALTAVSEGRDPFAERTATREQERAHRRQRAAERQQRAAARARRAVTFGKLCGEYVEWRTITPSGRFRRPASPRTLAEWRSIQKLHVLPLVGDIAVEDLTRDDFVRVLEHAVKHGGPSMGPRVREFVAAVWRWIEARPRLLRVQLPAESPMRELPRDIGAATTERSRVLTPAELWRFWRAAEGEGLAGIALRFSLLTAARVREATELPGAEIDFQTKTWRLPAARNKGGRDREIPLSAAAVRVLERARTLHTGEYVFDRLRVDQAMVRLRAAVGGESWQPRDLRRTA
ncbi:MAG TPA: integrase arm-type DNA-binding domain-containing protein, partial [Vicinamibacteria bacterium]|nr:integrase arm-type DNA-binding domain-containing protein [Vicinamibacteria bacterium]